MHGKERAKVEFQNFRLEIDEQGVAVFTSNRPEKMNALDDTSWREISVSYTHLWPVCSW